MFEDDKEMQKLRCGEAVEALAHQMDAAIDYRPQGDSQIRRAKQKDMKNDLSDKFTKAIERCEKVMED